MASIALVWPHAVHAQVAPTFARLQPVNRVEILDLENDTWHQVYQSDAWGTTALSVGPSGDRLALLAWSEGVVAGRGYVTPPIPRLVVLDTAGRLLERPVMGVQRYAWCGAACIVYITGTDEESHVGFVPDSVGMLNLANGRIVGLPKPPTPIGVTWGAFDSAAYIKNRARVGEAAIYRVDLRTLTLEATPYKDHLFSPTGRYYLHRPEFADTFIVYATSTNTPIDVARLRRVARIIDWGSPDGDVLLVARRPPPAQGETTRRPRPRLRVRQPGEADPELTYQLYDLPAGRLRGTLSGYLGLWTGPTHHHLIRSGGDYQTLPFSAAEERRGRR